MEKQIGYKDIFLKPQKCIVDSRILCDTSVKLGKQKFDMPVIASNMKSVVNIETCKFFARNNWFYIMHRFGINSIDFILEMDSEGLFTSISIGINDDSYKELERIYQEGLSIDYITIDVANAWSDKTHRMVDFIKTKFPEIFLIVGNIATSEAIKEIQTWNIDAAKIGIAGGKVCLTKNKTGIHRGMINTILDCCQVAGVPIIADGGIVEHGDVAKSLACGARMVMAGSLFSGYDQSAGNIIEIEDRMYKEYYGSASKYNKNEYKNVEGKKILIDYKGDMNKLLIELKEDLQSSISYTGGNCLKDLNGTECYVV
jgi:GMP reductase